MTNNDSVPLDDLLPSNDEVFEPVDSGNFFDSGSAFWEVADVHKWPVTPESFQAGYRAAMFDAALKSGRSFLFITGDEGAGGYRHRAQQFRRTIEVADRAEGLAGKQLFVSGHNDSE